MEYCLEQQQPHPTGVSFCKTPFPFLYYWQLCNCMQTEKQKVRSSVTRLNSRRPFQNTTLSFPAPVNCWQQFRYWPHSQTANATTYWYWIERYRPLSRSDRLDKSTLKTAAADKRDQRHQRLQVKSMRRSLAFSLYTRNGFHQRTEDSWNNSTKSNPFRRHSSADDLPQLQEHCCFPRRLFNLGK